MGSSNAEAPAEQRHRGNQRQRTKVNLKLTVQRDRLSIKPFLRYSCSVRENGVDKHPCLRTQSGIVQSSYIRGLKTSSF